MLDKIPSPLSGATCNEKTGWLPPNFDDMAREILSETIMKQMSTEGNEEEAMATDGDEAENAGAEEFENDDDLDNDDIEDDENEVSSRRGTRFQARSLSFVFLFAG